MTAQQLGSGPYRVLIIEDHALFAEALDLALTLEGYEVHRLHPEQLQVTAPAMLALARQQRPRLVLLDLDLGPFGDAARLIRPLAESGANVVVITADADRARWGECLYLGARAVVSKTRPLNEVQSVVRRLHHGLSVCAVDERELLLEQFRLERSEIQLILERFERLTLREQQVLGRLMAGDLVREIATTDFVSPATVRTQVKSILTKLDVSSQLSAVGLAHRVAWRPPGPAATDRVLTGLG